MKTLLISSLRSVVVSVFLFALAAQAQPQLSPEQLAARRPLDPTAIPNHGSFWLLKSPNPGRPYPPLPCPPGDLPGVPIYALGGGQYLVDDSEVDWDAVHAAEQQLTSLEAQYGILGPQPDGPSPLDYKGSTNLLLSITAVSNQVAELVLHNTSNAVPYEIISSETLTNALTNWISEGIWLGLTSNTPANVAVGGRTNQLFFRGRVWAGVFDHGVPTNGQLFVLVNTNTIYPVIDGVSTQLTTFYGSWIMLDPPLHCVNLGYDASDGGITNSLLNTNPPQGVLKLVGFSPTVTNLCLSYNPLTNIDVSGWPALQDLECWHCTNMLTVSVRNCPQLSRVCFEAIQGDTSHGITGTLDFTGCPSIAEIRAADNRLSNINFANGAGPLVWHLCIHDNSVPLPANMDFSHFPSLRELWIWRDDFGGSLTLTSANCTNLTSVEATANYFTSADFSGQTNLDHIYLENTPALTNLTIAGCGSLKQVRAGLDSLPSSVVDAILTTLDQAGMRTNSADGSLDVELQGGANGVPSPDGMRAALNLSAKKWFVLIKPQPSGTPQISSVGVAPRSNDVVITWTTDIAADSAIYYGTTLSYGSHTNDPSSTTTHAITISGLAANTTYHFYVHSTSGAYTGTTGDIQFTTAGGPAIYFVNTSPNVTMQVRVTDNPAITWYWGDGTASVGATPPTHSLPPNSVSSVVVSPASAVTGFGVTCQNTYETTLDSVSGLTNYPNIQGVFLYLTALRDLSLTGCTNLTYAALVGCTNATTATANAWFNDLAVAQANISQIGYPGAMCSDPARTFFCPANKVDSGSSTARQSLANKGWTILFY